ncbi:hypothetical protein E2C06_24035 [Dankookia rubra]|uniref:DUF4145 domain-containing protein n=1 Tax=Dankookia rubra TaxID=1442381 RepID=A0A4R5QAM1_9PROT|nr:hypothetical protein [Dankookia rubra]TDH60112.1 hypothetical protein E2C06_24035 [Dankookia rubra]
MTWLAFVAAIVGSLAWPTALVILAFGFRRQITTSLGRLTKAKGFGGELEFAQGLDKAEDLAPPAIAKQDVVLPLPTQHATATTGEAEKADGEPSASTYRLNAKRSDPPEYRVMSAWNLLSTEIAKVAEIRGVPIPKILNSRGLSAIAPALGLSADDITQIDELRKLRNQSVHIQGTLTDSDANRYEDLVLNLLIRLEDAARNIRREP